MAFRVRVKARGRPGTRLVVEEGTIFEVVDVTSNAPQTLRVLQTTVVGLDSDSPQVFDLDTECLNPSRRAPKNDRMRLTPFLRS